ncbi:MAG TPA: carboxypeptidase-like regulatory domain-containing protein [Bryobacteraceae bacterium]|nr:carboxypeptidase-like regulatory domain-containing protein [Bryobacteraceae bacterium]
MASLRVLICLAALGLQLPAQDSRGTIVGRVFDPTGAVVPGAEVKATNVATGVVASAKSNEAGNFTLPYLIPGRYDVTVESAGFKTFVQKDVEVRINDQVNLPIEMQLGTSAESVQVTAETPLLSTVEASLGQVVDERRVTELPLFAGNPMDLVHLAPGTVNGTNLRLRKAPFNNAPSQFSTDGSGNYQNEFTIDGVPNTYSDGTQPRVAFSPPQTAISEFKIQTSQYDASIGHTLGSVVNVSTKSGTNELHGEAHWWVRNRIFDAKNIFQNRSGQKLPVYQDNRYGVSGGAPVIIPKLYNGKNRTFWFWAWEANKFGDPGSATSTVPTEAMRRGDFSAFLALGSQYQLYNPFTTRQVGSRFVREPFAGNVIPQNLLDPVGQKLINSYPPPNQATGDRESRNNYFNPIKALEDYWVHIGRFDHAFSDKQRIFIRMHRDFWEEDKNRIFGRQGVNGIILNQINRGIAFDDVYMWSPSFLVNARYGITAQEFPERRVTRGFNLASPGFSPALTSLVDASVATFPRVRAGSLTTLSSWESEDGTTSSITHSVNANFTKLVAAHNIKFGPEFRVYREFRNRFGFATSPDLNFNSTYTRAASDSPDVAAIGPIASLLLGVPAGEMVRTASYAEQDKYWGLYVHDDWKITRTLTLNLGVRYEYETPITERFDRSVRGFAFGAANPIEAAARTAYARNPIPELPVDQFRAQGGLTFVGVDGNPREYWKGEKNNIMPRIGFAWQLFPKTVVRGGYGMFYNSIGVNRTNSVQNGFSQSTPIQASTNSGLSFQATTANPFPSGLTPAPGASGGLRTSLGQDIRFFSAERKQPYAQRWSVGLQQEVMMGFVIEAAYVGNKAVRLPVDRELNPVPRQYLSTSPVRDQPAITFLSASFPNPFFGLGPVYTQNISRSQLLRPYPHFGDVRVSEPIGYSWYHSLQSRVEKRFSHGYTLQMSYTFSKTMEATSFLNDSDPFLHEVISQLDRPHRFVGSGIWELPFGRGRKWGGSWHRVVNFVAGGWQLNGVYQHQSGEPLGFGNRIYSGRIEDLVLPADQRSVDHWFVRDPNGRAVAFNNNSGQQLTNNIRTLPLRFSQVRGPSQDRWDLSAIKNFMISERAKMQFRAECFNAMNHPNLSNPNTDPTNTAFGTITGQDSPRSWQMALKLSF